jgi:hypothetical protein
LNSVEQLNAAAVELKKRKAPTIATAATAATPMIAFRYRSKKLGWW